MCNKKCNCDVLDVLGFSGVQPSKTIPPSKPKHQPPQLISEGRGEINFSKNIKESKLRRIMKIIFE